jgi:hypothetical protein
VKTVIIIDFRSTMMAVPDKKRYKNPKHKQFERLWTKNHSSMGSLSTWEKYPQQNPIKWMKNKHQEEQQKKMEKINLHNERA